MPRTASQTNAVPVCAGEGGTCGIGAITSLNTHNFVRNRASNRARATHAFRLPGAWSALGQPERQPATGGEKPEGHRSFAQSRSMAGTGALCWARWPAAPTRIAKSLREQSDLTRTPPPALNPESVDAASNTKDLRGSWGGASEACHAGHAPCRHAEDKLGAHRKRLHKVASLPSPRLNIAWWCPC